MPIYEYECIGCGMRFERSQRIADEPIKTCPSCSGTTRRVLHPVGIIFKGSGFYVTDNRKPSTPSGSSTKSDGDPQKSESSSTEAPGAKSSTSDKEPSKIAG